MHATDTRPWVGLATLLWLTGPSLAAWHGEDFNFHGISGSGCQRACTILQQTLSTSVSLPNTTAFDSEKDSYWSAIQAEVSPRCFVQPTCADDVSAIVRVAERTNCSFAVRSGGHAAFAGASNVADGITIDLRLLNEVTVTDDKTTTRVGTGNHWIDVYNKLVPQDLAVIGGRVSGIGVGGLTLGGGISFLSGRHGWACDNVRNYELVTARGEVLEVNYTSYPDLYWALRGGGNNFGIVTRFDMETYPQGQMWGGTFVSPIATNDSLLHALVDLGENGPQDPDGFAWVAFVYVQSLGVYLTSPAITYAKPIANPPILDNFTAVLNSSALQSDVGPTNISALAVMLNASNPDGLRESYWTITVKNNLQMLQATLDIFVEETNAIRNVSGILPAVVMQPISTDVIRQFSKNGGNALGIDVGDGPLQLINPSFMWLNPSDDAKVIGAAQRMIDRMGAKAKELGVDFRYLYQNYAAQGQDVFDSYGEANRERLVSISKKYDPKQVFRKLQPGYFKL